jgi:hypothetical protein
MQQARDSNDHGSTWNFRLTTGIRGTSGRRDERKLIADRAEETVEVVQNHEGGTGSVALGGQRPRPGNRLE